MTKDKFDTKNDQNKKLKFIIFFFEPAILLKKHPSKILGAKIYIQRRKKAYAIYNLMV